MVIFIISIIIRSHYNSSGKVTDRGSYYLTNYNTDHEGLYLYLNRIRWSNCIAPHVANIERRYFICVVSILMNSRTVLRASSLSRIPRVFGPSIFPLWLTIQCLRDIRARDRLEKNIFVIRNYHMV